MCCLAVGANPGSRSRLAQLGLVPRLSGHLIPSPPVSAKPKTVTLGWIEPGLRFEIWSTTNLSVANLAAPGPGGWVLVTNMPGTIEVRLPADKPAEFFRVRAVDSNGITSDWGTTR